MIGKRADSYALLLRIFVVSPRVPWIVGLKVGRIDGKEEGEGVTLLVKRTSRVGKECGRVPCMKARKFKKYGNTISPRRVNQVCPL